MLFTNNIIYSIINNVKIKTYWKNVCPNIIHTDQQNFSVKQNSSDLEGELPDCDEIGKNEII